MKSKRQVRMLALICCVLLASALSAVNSEPVTITFSYWGSAHEHEIWTEVLEAFAQQHPDIRVDPLYVTGSYSSKMQVMIAAGNAPDVMNWEDKLGLPLVPTGAFMDLKPLMDKDPSFQRQAYYPITLEDFQFKGQQWALPWDFITTCIIYNKELFDGAGIGYPPYSWQDDRWNWQSFIETAKKLTIDKDGDGIPDQWGFPNTYSWSRWRIWVWQNGGLDWEPTGTRSLLTSEPTVSALQFIADMTHLHRISPTQAGINQLGGELKMFSEQRVGMATAAAYNLPYFRENFTFNWDLAAFARGPVRNASPLIPDGVTISSQTKQVEQAWQLVKFITSLSAQRIMAERGYRISPRRDVLARFITPLTPQKEEVWIEAVDHAILTNYTTQWTRIENETIRPAIQGLLNGQYSARQMVEQINPRVEALLAEAETRFAK
ncbi:MAG: sugar ABC transporter substrate-binding protein [Firmicutes bacterium]|nr:sugar ABC transporter substrate-binding protein [Bacillota bacterium]